MEQVDEVRVDPAEARLYAEGWQSWSPTSWLRWGARHRPAEHWQHTMRFRSGVPLADDATVHAEGLLVVDPGTGDDAVLYGVEDASEAVASLQAVLTGDVLRVSADGPVRTLRRPHPVPALVGYADGFAARAGVTGLREPPNVWCSWYRYFEDVTAADILENAVALDRHGLPVDVVQIDDGWSTGVGEWLAPTPGFPDLDRLVGTLRDGGHRVGIWLAPFTVGAHSTVARDHPDWLVGDAGFNWGQELRALDLTHPAVRDYLATEVSRLRGLGVDYFKLDFVYAGAIPGERHDDVTGVAAYRSGLRLIREAAGPDAFLLGCGAPILPSVGLVDAMRVSPDTFHEGGETGGEGLRGRMSLVARAWQQGRFWVNDPDCLVTRPSYRLRGEWAETFATFGGLRSFSDRLAELDEWGLETTRRLLSERVPPRPFDDEVLHHALAEAVAP